MTSLDKVASPGSVRQLLLFGADFMGSVADRPIVKKASPRRGHRTPQYKVECLQFPLFDSTTSYSDDEIAQATIPDTEFSKVEAIGIAPDDFVDSEVSEARNEFSDWTDDEFIYLHSYLLESSLLALRGYRNGMQKQEILDWMFEPDYIGAVTQNGQLRHVFTREVPFTFAFCCRLEQMDPEVYRDAVRRKLPAQTEKFM